MPEVTPAVYGDAIALTLKLAGLTTVLLLLVQGLGLSMQVVGWGDEVTGMAPPPDATPHAQGGPGA